MMMGWLLGVGCGWLAPQQPAASADTDAGAAVADALCKLAQGASRDCAIQGTSVSLADHTIGVAAFLGERQDVLGQVTFSGTIELTLDGHVHRSAWHGYGWGVNEAINRSAHVWALVYGTAFVDALLDPVERPALAAVEPQPSSAQPIALAGNDVLRGWTLWRGAETTLDHPSLLALLEPALVATGNDRSRTVQIRIQPGQSQQIFTCHVDGRSADALCDAARAYAWPSGFGWEVATAYVHVGRGSP